MKRKFNFSSIIVLGLILISCGTGEVNGQVGHNQEKLADGLITYQTLFDARDKENIACYRIPAIVTAPNGDLIAAIDERVPSCADLRGNKDINIVQRRSTDNGKTWTDIETVIDFPFGQSASDPSMIVDEETGDIFLFYNYMDLENEKNIYYLHVLKSSDNGKTWSEPIDITSQITKPEWHEDFKFITSGRGIQTQSGRLLHTLVNLDHGLHLFGSDDHGKTWFFIDTLVRPADESKVIQLVDGSYMINSRVGRDKDMRYVHISDDKGGSWETKPVPELIDPGNNAGIIRYTSVEEGFDKNRLLFVNAKNKDARKNLTIRISYDEGKTWSEGKTIYSGGAAYSSLTILENGDIGVFFEKDDYKENAFVSFSLDWLTEGQDEYKEPENRE
ncbi:MAG TPA: sialidase family protein [Salinimicrobium sp.]|nr:sialidase family protein [Salinimicrobium sp.]